MSSRLLIGVLACASALSLSSLPWAASAFNSSGALDLSSETAGTDPVVETQSDAAADKLEQEIKNCTRNAEGVKYEEVSQEQLECQAGVLGEMESSAKAIDYFDKYFRPFLDAMLKSEDAGDHQRGADMIEKLLSAIDGKDFTSIEKSLKAMQNKAKYLSQKDTLLEQRLAVDVVNDPDAEEKLAAINKKEVLLEGQYNGKLAEGAMDAGLTTPGTTPDEQQIMNEMQQNIAEAQRMYEMYHGSAAGYQRGGDEMIVSGDQVNQKAEPLFGETGLGLPAAPQMPAPGQGYGASVPGLDTAPN